MLIFDPFFCLLGGSITATSPKPDLNESQSSHEAPDDPKSPAEAPLEVSQSVGGSVEEVDFIGRNDFSTCS